MSLGKDVEKPVPVDQLCDVRAFSLEMCGLGFGDFGSWNLGLGLRVYGLGFRELGFRLHDLEFRELGFGV